MHVGGIEAHASPAWAAKGWAQATTPLAPVTVGRCARPWEAPVPVKPLATAADRGGVGDEGVAVWAASCRSRRSRGGQGCGQAMARGAVVWPGRL